MEFRQVRSACIGVWLGLAAVASVSAAERPASHLGESASRKTEAELEDRAATSEPSTGSQGRLLHATPAEVRARFGDPDVSRSEGKGAFWTYRMPHCALFLFFQDSTKGLKVSGASTGPRKRGEPAPTVEACLAQAIETPQ